MSSLVETFQHHVQEVQRWWASLGKPQPNPSASQPVPEERPAYSTAEPAMVRLPNGVVGAVQYFPSQAKMSIGSIRINVGSFHDPEGKEGLAHCLEHMLYDSGLRDEFKRRGGDINAATNNEGTRVMARLPASPENDAFLLQTLKNIVTNRDLSGIDVENEKKRIYNEIGMNNDSPESRLGYCCSLAFENPGAFNANLGTRKSVSGISRDDMTAFMNRYYNASNMVVLFRTPHPERTGAIADAIKSTFGDIKPGETAPAIAAAYRPYELRDNHGTGQLYFSYMVNVPEVDASDRFTSRVYTEYIKQMVHRELIDGKIAYEAHAGSSPHEPGKPAMLGIWGNVLPEDADKIGPAVARILGQTAHGIDPAVFAVARSKVLEQFAGGESEWHWNHTTDDVMRSLAETGRPESCYEQFQGLTAVTSADLQAFAQSRVLLREKPSVYADGDSELLMGQAAFEAQLQQEVAQPRRGISPEHQPATA